MDQILALLKNLSLSRKIALVLAALLTTTFFFALITWMGKIDFTPLYFNNLSFEDAGKVTEKLKELKVSYRLSENGRIILVPENQIYEVRMELAREGLPRGGGIGFEIFDRSKLGMTDFLQNINFQRALQGELVRTINQLFEVEQSRVHLVFPKKSLFVEDQEKPTASVVLKVTPGRRLKKKQVQGIAYLIASSVEGLKPEKVTILNTRGEVLFSGEESDNFNFSGISNSQLEYRHSLERSLEKKIQGILERVVGEGKVVSRVSAQLNFLQVEKTREIYDNIKPVIRSRQILEEKTKEGEETSSGPPGVGSNLPENQKKSTSENKSPYLFLKKDETVNYEISKEVSREIEPTGNIQRLSIAVMVDGVYKMVEGEDGTEKKQYFARPPEEMEKFVKIAKMAVGYNGKRGDQIEVTNIPFETIELSGEEDLIKQAEWRNLWISLAKYGSLVIVFLLFFFLFLKPFLNWMAKTRFEQPLALPGGLPQTVTQLESQLSQPAAPSQISNKEITDENKAVMLAKNDIQGTTKVIQNWVKEKR